MRALLGATLATGVLGLASLVGCSDDERPAATGVLDNLPDENDPTQLEFYEELWTIICERLDECELLFAWGVETQTECVTRWSEDSCGGRCERKVDVDEPAYEQCQTALGETSCIDYQNRQFPEDCQLLGQGF